VLPWQTTERNHRPVIIRAESSFTESILVFVCAASIDDVAWHVAVGHGERPAHSMWHFGGEGGAQDRAVQQRAAADIHACLAP